MKTFKQYITESRATKLRSFLRRDQSPREMADRSNLHKDVLSHFSNDEVGDERLKHAMKTDSNAIWTLAQHAEHHPEFQQRVLTHLEKGQNLGDISRSNFLRDRMAVNNELRKNHSEKEFADIRDNTKKWDHKSQSYVPRTENDVLPGHPDWKPPTSPKEALERISDPNHPEYRPHLAQAVKNVMANRPKNSDEFTQPSFAVNSEKWMKK